MTKEQTRVDRSSAATYSVPLRVAVVGVGGVAHWQHLPCLHALADEAQLVAIVDVDEEHLDKTAALYNVPHRFKSVGELLHAGLDLQAALVLTPPEHHAVPVIELLQAGLPVFCEKPLAYDLGEAEEIVRVAEAENVPFMIGFNRRFAATVRAVKDTLQVARPELILAEKSKPVQSTNRQRLLEFSIHALDTLRWLAEGEVVSLEVTGSFEADSGLEQTVVALLRFDNGVIGVLTTNAHGAKWIERYEVYADQATLIVEYPVRLRRFLLQEHPLSDDVSGLLEAPPEALEVGHLDGEPVLQLKGALCPVDEAAALGFQAELEHFFQCVRRRTKPLTSGAEALTTQRLAHRIQQELRLAADTS